MIVTKKIGSILVSSKIEPIFLIFMRGDWGGKYFILLERVRHLNILLQD